MPPVRPVPAVSVCLLALLLSNLADPRESWGAEDTDEGLRAEDHELIESLRNPLEPLRAPHAISVLSSDEFSGARPGLDLEEGLYLVPGVFAQSSRNFAQDTRVSIRGFGARSRFGVRGIRVLVDGIPTSLPDGQSEIDSVELGFVDRIEVVRGPISSLYGGGGGGILSLYTHRPTKDPVISTQTTWGTDHLSRYQALYRDTVTNTGVVLGLARSRYSGYRDHARGEQNNFLAKLERNLPNGGSLRFNFSGIDAPEGQDPGGLTLAQVGADRQQARPGFFGAQTRDAGETLDQQKFSLSWRQPIAAGQTLRLNLYQLSRDFENKLPFETSAQVDLRRKVYGAALTYGFERGRWPWLAGIDADWQRDFRQRFDNQPGGVRGPQRIRQSENVRSIGPFAQLELQWTPALRLVAGARYDWTELDVGDRMVDDGDQSDEIRFRELSPRVGFSYAFKPELTVYGNVSSAFEVPTTTELRPRGQIGGFDSVLDPERALGFELGAKGLIAGRLFFDLALFQIHVDDALVPFEDNSGTFFQNAGEVRRRGVELAASAELLPGLSVRGSYTYSHHEYLDFDKLSFTDTNGDGIDDVVTVASLDDREEPNSPRHQAGAEIRYEHDSGFFGSVSLRHFSDVEVNDENTLESDGATVSDARMGFTWQAQSLMLKPYVGVRNAGGRRYNGTVRVNDGFGRYFEPAPGTQFYGGLGSELELD